MLGALADLIGRNRQLLEQTLERVRMLEDKMTHSESATEANVHQVSARKPAVRR
jgi:hypothetical protein